MGEPKIEIKTLPYKDSDFGDDDDYDRDYRHGEFEEAENGGWILRIDNRTHVFINSESFINFLRKKL